MTVKFRSCNLKFTGSVCDSSGNLAVIDCLGMAMLTVSATVIFGTWDAGTVVSVKRANALDGNWLDLPTPETLTVSATDRMSIPLDADSRYIGLFIETGANNSTDLAVDVNYFVREEISA